MPKPMVRKKVLSIDFTGVEGGGRSCPDGRYVGKLKSWEQAEGSDSGQPYLACKFSVNGATVYDNFSLQPQALWRLKGYLQALGTEVPDGAFDLDMDECIGVEVGVEITNEKYNGKDKPRITDFFGADQVGEAQGGGEASSTSTPTPITGSKIKVGSTVKFNDDENHTYTGKVKAIADDVATVDVKGDEWEVELENLSLA